MRAGSATQPSRGGSKKRDEILRTAGKLFREKGYHATSMRELASRVNVQGASLYAHIDSKEAVLQEIVERAADAFLLSAAAAAHGIPEGRLARFIAGHLSVVESELETATVFFHEWTHLRGEALKSVMRKRDAYEAALQEIIEAGMALGVFQVDDARMATLLTLSTLNWSYQWLDPGGRLGGEELRRAFTAYVLAALGHQAPAKG